MFPFCHKMETFIMPLNIPIIEHCYCRIQVFPETEKKFVIKYRDPYSEIVILKNMRFWQLCKNSCFNLSVDAQWRRLYFFLGVALTMNMMHRGGGQILIFCRYDIIKIYLMLIKVWQKGRKGALRPYFQKSASKSHYFSEFSLSKVL